MMLLLDERRLIEDVDKLVDPLFVLGGVCLLGGSDLADQSLRFPPRSSN